jgi:hypothetical protein
MTLLYQSVAAGWEEEERMESRYFLSLETPVSITLETSGLQWRLRCPRRFWE